MAFWETKIKKAVTTNSIFGLVTLFLLYLSSCQMTTATKTEDSFPRVVLTVEPEAWQPGDTVRFHSRTEWNYPGTLLDLSTVYIPGKNPNLTTERKDGSFKLLWITDSLNFPQDDENKVWVTGSLRFPEHDITFATEEEYHIVQNDTGFYHLVLDDEFYYLEECPCEIDTNYVSPTREKALEYVEKILRQHETK